MPFKNTFLHFFLSGFVSGLGQSLSKFKTSSTKTPVNQHRRSRSVKAELMRINKDKYSLDDNALDKKGSENHRQAITFVHEYMNMFILLTI